MLTEGNWISGSAGSGSSIGGRFDWSLFTEPAKFLDTVVEVVFANPEAAIISMAPLPIVGAPWSPQQVMWRTSLVLAGVRS